jgi:hypothetical protein
MSQFVIGKGKDFVMQRRTFLNASVGLVVPSVLATTSSVQAADPATRMVRPLRKRDLKALDPAMRVVAIHRRDDTYEVRTAGGAALRFREFDLRFNTDSTDTGPEPGGPAILRAAARGDRATIVFASASEIGAFVQVTPERS